ncbi:Protein kinase C signaling pathway involved MAPKK protein [Tilletia horrida]|nr:Protein kinase C signaling pathway involved MAPKK protein [Tilletia horrida]
MESVIPPKPAKRLGMPKLSIPSRPSSSASSTQVAPPPFGGIAGNHSAVSSSTATATTADRPSSGGGGGFPLSTPPQPLPPFAAGAPFRSQPSSGHSSSGSINSLPGTETSSNSSSPSHEWHLGAPGGMGHGHGFPYAHGASGGAALLHIPAGHGTGTSSTYSTNATVRASGVGVGSSAGYGGGGGGGGAPMAYGGSAGGYGGYSSSMYPDTVPFAGENPDPAALTNDLRRAISGLSLSSSRGSVDLDAGDLGGSANNHANTSFAGAGPGAGSAESGAQGENGSAFFQHRIRRISAPGSDAGGSDVGVSFTAGDGPGSGSGSGSGGRSIAGGAGGGSAGSTPGAIGGVDSKRASGSEQGAAAGSRPGYPRSHSSRTDDGSQGGHDDEVVLEGNLKILFRLGEGSSGEVQKALHVPTGLMMAKKSISTSPNPDIHRQILRELSFLRTCHSPYIVKYYGAFLEEEDTQIAICMEFCEGGSLDAIYRRVMARNGRTGEKVLAKVAECVLKGLEYLHERNIIHRDIKPSNIVLTRQGQIKLCDLGVAGELVNSVAGTFTGTSYYMAPERIQGSTNYKINSDVWSLGLTLLEVASNRFPFPPEGEPPLGPFDLITYVIAMEIPQLMDDPEKGIKWSRPMRDFIQRTLEKDQNKRPGPGRMLQHPWIRRSEERQPQPDIARFVAEVWGWDYPAPGSGSSATGPIGNATPSSPAPPGGGL